MSTVSTHRRASAVPFDGWIIFHCVGVLGWSLICPSDEGYYGCFRFASIVDNAAMYTCERVLGGSAVPRGVGLPTPTGTPCVTFGITVNPYFIWHSLWHGLYLKYNIQWLIWSCLIEIKESFELQFIYSRLVIDSRHSETCLRSMNTLDTKVKETRALFLWEWKKH